MSGETVCVTGGSGFLGSYVVKLLLEKGYRVKTTVRDVTDTKKVAHLRALPGAAERLELFQADLLQEGSFDAAIKGCSGVFHTASPFFTKNQTRDALVVPAVEGTLNVLRSCARQESVRRVILTSSMAAIYVHCDTLPDDHVFTEADWSNEERMEKLGLWYCLSKTVAERTAHAFVADNRPNFDLVAMCPTLIFGPMLQPVVNESSDKVLKLANGDTKTLANAGRCFVDVRDVAQAHIAGFETASAAGRYMLVSCYGTDKDVVDAIRKVDPAVAINLPTAMSPGPPPPRINFDTSKARTGLGIVFRSLETMVEGTCKSLHEHTFL
ncbi:dihydroflavonol-4-reductase [Achlya hypogyna]|uniref:Dihydroflavonol-4-reductase n=1 Tax=Achlya hypogyna TaxID=1202772 RepID=A0A1V9ZFX2_ACHHY|nr:dihydroflavonol-4-reductase [Achlya hypogyna]